MKNFCWQFSCPIFSFFQPLMKIIQVLLIFVFIFFRCRVSLTTPAGWQTCC
jgi:hypothetical protein